MFFFYISSIILIILIILIIFTTIQIHIENIRFQIPKMNKRNINTDYKITIKFYIFKKINYLKFDITKNKLEEKFIAQKINKLKEKMKKKENKISTKQIKSLKKMKLKVQQINLKIHLGIEDASLNAIIVGILSSSIAIIFGVLMDKNVLEISKKNEEDKIYWKIIPVYQNRNLLNINLDCIFSFKLIHIIYISINSPLKNIPKLGVNGEERKIR